MVESPRATHPPSRATSRRETCPVKTTMLNLIFFLGLVITVADNYLAIRLVGASVIVISSYAIAQQQERAIARRIYARLRERLCRSAVE